MKSINPLYRAEDLANSTSGSQTIHPKLIQSVLSNETPIEAIDLIERLLEYEPQKRITALEALNHPYFDELK